MCHRDDDYLLLRASAVLKSQGQKTNDGELHLENPPTPFHVASARQPPENQKENQAGHSPERAVENPLECGIALGLQPGSCRLPGHQPNRTRLRGQCGSSAG